MAGKAQKGSNTHFVKWDDSKKGGRWFECNIVATANPDVVVAYPWDDPKQSKSVSKSNIVKIGHAAGQGDIVIAYWRKANYANYAFKGKVNGTRPGALYLDFDDGDSDWVSTDLVYKKVSPEWVLQGLSIQAGMTIAKDGAEVFEKVVDSASKLAMAAA